MTNCLLLIFALTGEPLQFCPPEWAVGGAHTVLVCNAESQGRINSNLYGVAWDGTRAIYAATGEPVETEAVPPTFADGLETPRVVLTDAEGRGWATEIVDGQTLVYLEHASPRASASERAERRRQQREWRVGMTTNARAVRAGAKAIRQTYQALPATNFPSGPQRQAMQQRDAQVVALAEQVRLLADALVELSKGYRPTNAVPEDAP